MVNVFVDFEITTIIRRRDIWNCNTVKTCLRTTLDVFPEKYALEHLKNTP